MSYESSIDDNEPNPSMIISANFIRVSAKRFLKKNIFQLRF